MFFYTQVIFSSKVIPLSVLNVIRVFEIKFRIRNFFMHTKHGYLADTVKLTRSISFNDSS